MTLTLQMDKLMFNILVKTCKSNLKEETVGWDSGVWEETMLKDNTQKRRQYFFERNRVYSSYTQEVKTLWSNT